MTKDDNDNPGQPQSPDDSSEVLLASLKRSISDPAMPAVTEEEIAAAEAAEARKMDEARERHDTLPPWSPDKIRREQIQAWNNMAEQMIHVVRTVKINEQKNEATVARVRTLVIVAMLTVLGGTALDWYGSRSVRSAAVDGLAALEQRLVETDRKQDLMLKAIIEQTEAQALLIEAMSSFDPEKDQAARAAALEAHRAALEAKKATTQSP